MILSASAHRPDPVDDEESDRAAGRDDDAMWRRIDDRR